MAIIGSSPVLHSSGLHDLDALLASEVSSISPHPKHTVDRVCEAFSQPSALIRVSLSLMIGRAVLCVMYVHGTHAAIKENPQPPPVEAESHTLRYLGVTQTDKVVRGSTAQR